MPTCCLRIKPIEFTLEQIGIFIDRLFYYQIEGRPVSEKKYKFWTVIQIYLFTSPEMLNSRTPPLSLNRADKWGFKLSPDKIVKKEDMTRFSLFRWDFLGV